MWKYILRRLTIAIPVLFVISVLDFAVINLAPGDPLQAMLPHDKVSVAATAAAYQAAGLNDSIPVRYVRWIAAMAHGNFGTSFQSDQPTTTIIAQYLPNTLVLTVTAMALALLMAIPLGILAAFHERSFLDEVSTLGSFMLTSIPGFFLALLAVYFVSVNLHLLPATQIHDFDKTNDPLDLIHHLILPAVVLAVLQVPGYIRYVRSSVLDVMRQDYIRTAKAKGLLSRRITWAHIFPNALAPVVTILGLSLPGLIGSSVLIEQVFAWPGLGTLSINAALFRDYPVFMATSLLYAVAVLLSNLLADVFYAAADPRVRFG
jgi:peptide/nickel transport system permease protein